MHELTIEMTPVHRKWQNEADDLTTDNVMKSKLRAYDVLLCILRPST